MSCVALKDYESATFNGFSKRLRPKPNTNIVPEYVAYFFRSLSFRRDVSAMSSLSTRASLNNEMLERLAIVLPPIKVQTAIGSVLKSLDDKIELNRRMNETLEAMARAIFKSWFVDFDPVRAKLDGRQPPGMDKATAALFPDSFEHKNDSLVPSGWRIGSIGHVGENPRRSIKPEQIAPGTPYIALVHMPRRCIALSDWDIADNIASGKCEFHRGEILFGKLRPYFHKVGVPAVDGVCSTDILVIVPKSPVWFGFLLGHVSSDDLVNYTDMTSTGTKMPRTNWKDIAKYTVVLPPEPLAAVFTEHIHEIIKKILENIHESTTLAALRDTLLTKLLSGELRVADAERFTAGVT